MKWRNCRLAIYGIYPFKLPTHSKKGPSKLVVWTFGGQSTVLLLRSSCITTYICLILQIILQCTNVIFRNLTGAICVSSFVKVILGGKWGHFSFKESVKIVHFHHLKVRKKDTVSYLHFSALHISLLKADFRLKMDVSMEGMLIK